MVGSRAVRRRRSRGPPHRRASSRPRSACEASWPSLRPTLSCGRARRPFRGLGFALRLRSRFSFGAAATATGSSAAGAPFDDTTGTSPSMPSGVTMIECGRPSGPPPFFPAPRRSAASGDLRRHLLELVLQLRGGELAALQPVTRRDDFLDVELEDVAPAELAVRPLASSEKRAQRRPHSRSASVISLWISSYSAMASFDSLVKGTHTEAMWTKITIGPAGSELETAPHRSCATWCRAPPW